MKYGLIGEHLGHSFSKIVHESLNKYEYEIQEIKKESLESFMLAKDFKGINVTIPYKKDVIKYLDVISDEAREIGAVNTIINKDGMLYGYNTDYYGLKLLIEKNGIDIKNKDVLILGTGGSSNAAYKVCKDLGASKITKASRKSSIGVVNYNDIYNTLPTTQVIINTTPVGMYPNNYETLIDIRNFSMLESVVDLIYNPLRTNLILDALELGLKAAGGLYMLVAQGMYASSLFLDEEMDEEVTDTIYKSILRAKENIVLVGMPSSGKSVIGKNLRRNIPFNFYDTDDSIIVDIGMEIKDYFNKFGEASFREREVDIIKRLSKLQSSIISTGGGAILLKENVRALKQNGRFYFIDRSLEKLKVSDKRPLSNSLDKLTELFNKRYPLYLKVSDVRIDGDKEIPEKVIDILKDKAL